MKPSNHRLHWKVCPPLPKKDRLESRTRQWPQAHVVHKGEMRLFARLRCAQPYDKKVAATGNHPPLSVYVIRPDTGEWVLMTKTFVDFHGAKTGLAKFMDNHPEMFR